MSKQSEDSIVLEGIWEQGYGSIAKKVMRDRRLTDKSRLIYAYLSSFAGAGSSPCPKVSTICYDLCIGSEETFYYHMNYLKGYGYIVVRHRKDETGKAKSNVYVLPNEPIENQEYLIKIEKIKEKKKEKKESQAKKPTPNYQGMEKPTPNYQSSANQSSANQSTNNNSINNNSINKNKRITKTTKTSFNSNTAPTKLENRNNFKERDYNQNELLNLYSNVQKINDISDRPIINDTHIPLNHDKLFNYAKYFKNEECGG